ncbi:MAG: hypothetical protein K9G48_12675 [Reyranella sp.]|nr:hypothetical protein [Reyranella sp.]
MIALTDAELAELAAADRSATPGPWTAARPEQKGEEWPHGIIVAAVARGMGIYISGDSATFPSADRSLIVAARNALPALLAEVREHRQRRTATTVEMTMGDLGLPIWANPAEDHFCPYCVYRSQCRDNGYCWNAAEMGR